MEKSGSLNVDHRKAVISGMGRDTSEPTTPSLPTGEGSDAHRYTWHLRQFSQTVVVCDIVLTARGISGGDREKAKGQERVLRNVNSLWGAVQGSSLVRKHLSVILGLREECRCLGRMR